jgi:ribosomal protein L27
MKYRFEREGSVCVSSCGELKFVSRGEEVDFNEDDLMLQTLDGFVKVEEKGKKKKEIIEESDE